MTLSACNVQNRFGYEWIILYKLPDGQLTVKNPNDLKFGWISHEEVNFNLIRPISYIHQGHRSGLELTEI